MKKLLGGLLIAAVFAVSAPMVPPANAQLLPNFVVGAVAEVSAYKDVPFVKENRLKQGSGVFVDHRGCLYTNSHVALDLTIDEPVPHIVVKVTKDRSRPPEFAFEGEVIYVDQGLDLAYVCPKEETDLFTHFFLRRDSAQYEQVPFGKEVWVMGYPGAGEGTITISPGHVVGFIEQPDTTQWVGVPDLDPSRLSLYKADALAGPGISGGLLVDEDLNLMGIPFAGSLVPGAFIFVLSEKVYMQFERQIRQHLHEEGMVPSDCVYDEQTKYYYRAGEAYYDDLCEYSFDADMETEVRNAYMAFCKETIPQSRLVPAIARSKELGSLAKWSASLSEMCPLGEEQDAHMPDTQVSLQPGTFAYGKARLSLQQEQAMAKELKNIIDERFPGVEIDAKHWPTIVNAYVYGGYPPKAIIRAVELGGYTVHPTIPFEQWQKSRDYLERI